MSSPQLAFLIYALLTMRQHRTGEAAGYQLLLERVSGYRRRTLARLLCQLDRMATLRQHRTGEAAGYIANASVIINNGLNSLPAPWAGRCVLYRSLCSLQFLCCCRRCQLSGSTGQQKQQAQQPLPESVSGRRCRS